MSKEREFVELKPKMWQSLYSIYCTHLLASKEELIRIVAQAVETFGYSAVDAEPIACYMIKLFSSLETLEYIDKNNNLEACLYLDDIRLYKEKTVHEKNVNLKKLLLAFMLYARFNHHPSFWIKYDREEIFFLAGLSKLKNTEQENLTKTLHKCYDLNMQVVGSNSPMPCFQIEWLCKTYPEEFKVHVGTYSPGTIQQLLESLEQKGE